MSETRALLVTDIVDSTRIAEQLGDAAMSELWAAHDRRARDLLHRWRGREIDKSDGFLLLFEHVMDAVGYALDYHRALRTLPRAVAARAGIHVGAIELRANAPHDVARGAKPLEVEGLAKAIAARVMSAARGGQTLLSASARALLTDTSMLMLRSHGHWRLKGMPEPIELFESTAEDLRCEPPADTDKAWRVVRRGDHWLPVRDVHHGLPAEPDAFVGRADVLHALAALFDGGARLVCVHGIGGSGKTRLAQHFGWRWLGDFPGGVWFCDLSQARDLDGIVQAVARGLDVPLGRADPLTQLGAAIAGRGACLVIFDNFEQVAPLAEATLGVWLARAPQARLLVTSSESLRIPGEAVLPIAPMPFDDAAVLFRLRAASAGAEVARVGHDEGQIVELVRLLDGLPLAIELAAARCPVMPPRELVARMGERFKLLTSRGGRTERHSTLRATFDWSWDLLRPWERDALAQLSVFEGGATLAAIEAVVDLRAHADDCTSLDALQSLVEKSFVRQRPSQRFELLRSVQDYAAECLTTPGRFPGSGHAAVEAARARHRRYFAALPARQAVAGKCADLDNLVAAVRSAVAASEVSCVVGALEGAWEAFRMRGPYRTGIALVREARAIAGIDHAADARLDLIEGWLLKANGNTSRARERLNTALKAATLIQDPRLEGKLCLHLGDLDLDEGGEEQARRGLLAAVSLASAANDRQLQCAAQNSLGNLARYTGHLDEASAIYEAALHVARAAEDRFWIGSLLGNLGVVRDEQGRVTEAREHYEAALDVARAIGDRQREANTRCNLGLMLHLQGEQPQAHVYLSEALKSARELGHARLECIVLCNLALVAMAQDGHQEAHELFGAALRLARELSDRRTEGQILGYLGLLLARQRRVDQARETLQLGQKLLQEVSDRLGLAVLLCARVECEHLAGATGVAEAARTEAESIATELAVQSGSELAQRLRAVALLMSTEPTSTATPR